MTHPVTADRDVKWAPGTLPDGGKLKRITVVKTRLAYLDWYLPDFVEPQACGLMSLVLCVARCND